MFGLEGMAIRLEPHRVFPNADAFVTRPQTGLPMRLSVAYESADSQLGIKPFAADRLKRRHGVG